MITSICAVDESIRQYQHLPRGITYHTGFISCDIDYIWRYSSPANLSTRHDYQTLVLESEDLQDLMDQIEHYEIGRFVSTKEAVYPTANEVSVISDRSALYPYWNNSIDLADVAPPYNRFSSLGELYPFSIDIETSGSLYDPDYRNQLELINVQGIVKDVGYSSQLLRVPTLTSYNILVNREWKTI